MYYLGYDFNSHLFCITKKESKAVEFCFYNRKASDSAEKVQRKIYPLYDMTKEQAIKYRDDMNNLYGLNGEDDRYKSSTSWGVIKKCVQCGRPYFFPDPEKKFYDCHHLPEPARCFRCRSARKKKKTEEKSKQ